MDQHSEKRKEINQSHEQINMLQIIGQINLILKQEKGGVFDRLVIKMGACSRIFACCR